MSVLVILLPPRPRGPAAAQPPAEYAFVFRSGSGAPLRPGSAAAALLPRADRVYAVVPDIDVSWQRATIPKAPAARLRAALGAVLEDQLLDDDDEVHLALEPGAIGGQTGWVAVAHKPWLTMLVNDIEAAGVPIDRLLPLSWPGEPERVHAAPLTTDSEDPMLVWNHPDGVVCLRMSGALARLQLASANRAQLRCSAHPAAAAALERWIEGPVAVVTDAERAFLAARSPWNLRQFELAAHRRGTLALREAVRRLSGPDWRPVRLGVVALLLVQVIGLNAWAWRLEQSVQDKRGAMTRLLQSTHPQVRSVLDAPLQMRRETEQLRASAGRPGPDDLEALLAATATAWPDGQGPLQGLRFEPGRLSIVARDWGNAQRTAFSGRLQAAGYRAQWQDDRIVVTRSERT